MIHPLFKWFGSKWMSAKTLPAPLFDSITEPFAGGAGYSLRYCERKVTLHETDTHIRKLWAWLIGPASSDDVRDIPIGLDIGTDINSLGLSEGQALLLKSWQRTNNVGDCWTISPWGNKPGQWTANTRARVAEEIHAVKHWRIVLDEDGLAAMRYAVKPTTWFVDPQYEYNYDYRHSKPDYSELGRLCSSAPGQVIVCEAICQKTDRAPTWLPFREFGSRITSRRKAGENHHSRELIWENSPVKEAS